MSVSINPDANRFKITKDYENEWGRFTTNGSYFTFTCKEGSWSYDEDAGGIAQFYSNSETGFLKVVLYNDNGICIAHMFGGPQQPNGWNIKEPFCFVEEIYYKDYGED